MGWRKAAAGVLAAVLLLCAAGCRGTAAPTPTDAFSAPAEVPPAQPQRARVLFTLPGMEDAMMLEVARGMQDACDDVGAEVTIHDAGHDVAAQGEAIATFVTSGGQVVACWPVDDAGVAPYLQSAQDGGLAVISFGTQLPTAHTALTCPGDAAGRLLAQAVSAEWEDAATARGTVLVLEAQGHWLQGFEDGVVDFLTDAAPNMAVTSALVEADSTGYDTYLGLVEEHPDIVAVLCGDDALALELAAGLSAPADDPGADSAPGGAADAAPNHSVPEWFFIGGVGATGPALTVIRQGGYFRASVDFQPYAAGQRLANMAISAAGGKVPAQQAIDPLLVTANIAKVTGEPDEK